MCPQRMEEFNLAPASADATLDRSAEKAITKWKNGPNFFSLDPEKKIESSSSTPTL